MDHTVQIKMPAPARPAQKYSEATRKDLSKIATSLIVTFSWKETPEGHDFWDSVYERLTQMAERGY